MKYSNIREEALKNKVAHDFFGKFDCTEIIRDIDFTVKINKGMNPLAMDDDFLFWAEAKQKPTDIISMLTQLVLTVGKARTFDKILPPPFLGCFDCEKIAFVPYADIQDIFYQNDFNWNIAPSDHETREFRQVYAQIKKIINNDIPWETYLFDFEKDEKELKRFIRDNFNVPDKGFKPLAAKTRIDKNNFIIIYNKWLEAVQPTIAVKWEKAKARGIIDGDFYLADLLSSENKTLKEKLFVLLRGDFYEFDRVVDEDDIYNSKRAEFSDHQKAHTQFWAKYERPPLEDYWDYIVERRDLLVPQDVRERKGSFFTPKIWVELSQKYMADVLGEDWQEEYYVWDCAAGTGNLLAGLTNKYNIWASTLDKADVNVMKDRIRNGANLLESHVFQFDFLNDDFSKLPQGLQDIINDETKRKKLVIYINPPYAEATSTATRIGTKENKSSVATGNKIHQIYAGKLGKAKNELYALFLSRIYFEISDCIICEFSTQKALLAPNFKDFRKFFWATYIKGFIVPANTFDNVKGVFPIGFKIWDTKGKSHFTNATVDVYDSNGTYLDKKNYNDGPDCAYINDWIKKHRDKSNLVSAKLCYVGNDFQNNNKVQICSSDREIIAHDVVFNITLNNLIVASIYFAVRKVIPANWLNDRDQFLYPNDGWNTDEEFQNDCFAYTLFNNNIQSKYGINHWIPFTEYQVGARDKFDSNFMTDFIAGKAKTSHIVAESPSLFGNITKQTNEDNAKQHEFSETARNVFVAGRKLWQYYHAQPKCNVNASLYDIREHFQGRNDKGKMNNKSADETYNDLIGNLRTTLKPLAKKIEPKVYAYGFLKG